MSRKYNLTDEQIRSLAIIAFREQGSNDDGVRACASHMCNYYEKWQKKNYKNPYDCTIKSGWYGTESFNNEWIANHPNVPQSIVNSVSDVIRNGNRNIPDYVDEYDCLSDVKTATNYGASFPPEDRSQYKKDVTIITNRYGSTYTFYCFPGGANGYCDAFGWISKPSGATDTTDPPESTTSRKLISYGSTGSDVLLCQKRLKELGYKGADGKDLTLDGEFGANTYWAVRCFQADNGLDMDGVAGKMTWSKLL